MIRTVNGDVFEEDFGITLPHEHIQLVSNDFLKAFGDEWLDEKALEDCGVELLRFLKNQYKVGLYVDGTPTGLGRDVPLLQRISKRSGLHIVASSGMLFMPHFWLDKYKPEEIALWLLKECNNGMDGTTARAGLLKCGSDKVGVTEHNAKRLTAVGMVQKETGLPLYAHCSQVENTAFDQIDVLTKAGANAEKIVIGHVSNRLELDYLKKILDRGCYLGIDQGLRDADLIVNVTTQLCNMGFADKILFSNDYPIYNEFNHHSISGLKAPMENHKGYYSFFFNKLIPAFKESGMSENIIDMLFKKNTIKWLSIDANK